MRFAAARNAERPRTTDARPLRASLSHHPTRQSLLRNPGDTIICIRLDWDDFRILAVSSAEARANTVHDGFKRDDGASDDFLVSGAWRGRSRWLVFPWFSRGSGGGGMPRVPF